MEEKVLIDKETLKAIAVDTRLNIMKLLAKKKYTLSDLSSMLGLGNSTVKEHLDNLVKAELIEKEQTERKWKFYSITLKGRRLVEPRAITVLFMFALSTIGAIAAAVWFGMKVNLIEKMPVFAAREFAAEEILKAGADEAVAAAPEVAESVGTAGINPWIIFGIMVVLIGLSAFLLGYYLKKKVVIIQRKEKK
ncbi:winged helix-turn-helix domain-containing protein [Candidatus Woesearchaeota archaeon]|nr:winged helix-turn-helix domain-containing protein [Candidatus Woesearchaeota archaeon]